MPPCQTAGNVTLPSSRRCEVCGAYLRGRQQVACCDACRATRWRRQRETAQRTELEGIRLAVTNLRAGVDHLAERLDRAKYLRRAALVRRAAPSE